MKRVSIASTLGAVLLAGCAGSEPPNMARDMEKNGGGLFGDLRWNVDAGNGKWERVDAAQGRRESSAPAGSASQQDDFRKWQESAGSPERREFEEWRAWQEWKRKNPK